MARRGRPAKDHQRIKELCTPIRKAMDNQSVGPTKLGEKTGIPKQSIFQYYNCKSLPSYDRLNLMYEALGIQEILTKGQVVTTAGFERTPRPKPVTTQMKLAFEELKRQSPKVEVVRTKSGFELRIPIKVAS